MAARQEDLSAHQQGKLQPLCAVETRIEDRANHILHSLCASWQSSGCQVQDHRQAGGQCSLFVPTIIHLRTAVGLFGPDNMRATLCRRNHRKL